MGRLQKPYRLKKRGRVYYYQLKEDRTFHTTGETVKTRAEVYAMRMSRLKTQPDRSDLKLNRFARDFFCWGKCDWIKKMHKKGKSFSQAVARQRRGHLKSYILPQFGNKKIVDITTLDLENWLLELDLANQTKNHILYSLRIIFQEARNRRIISSTPCDGIDRFSIKPEKTGIFTKAERLRLFPENDDKLLEIWGDYFWASFFYILATTGLRPQEVLALKWQDWERKHDILIIDKAVKDMTGVGTTKTGKPKIAILIDQVIKVLTVWSTQAMMDSEDDYIFASRNNKPVTRRTYLYHFYTALKNAKIKTAGRKWYSIKGYPGKRLLFCNQYSR